MYIDHDNGNTSMKSAEIIIFASKKEDFLFILYE